MIEEMDFGEGVNAVSLNPLERRIIELSYAHQLTHVSSCLNVINVLSEVYARREENEPVILANGHAALALYVILESEGICNAEEMINRHGVHASRDMPNGIWCSNGSLGQSEPIAVGMALANRDRKVWLITSDGACSEGSVWEAFTLAEEVRLRNLHIYIIANGYGAYREIDVNVLWERCVQTMPHLPFLFHKPRMPFEWLEGLEGHYMKISDEQYAQAMA